MKIILLKDCKDGKANEVIEVAGGYATNFLIKKGLALPYNNKTAKVRSDKEDARKAHDLAVKANSEKAKRVIETITLSYKLRVTNLVVHGSITRKQIQKSLLEKGVKLDAHAIENVKITSLGISKVRITLPKGIIAILQVEVKEDGK